MPLGRVFLGNDRKASIFIFHAFTYEGKEINLTYTNKSWYFYTLFYNARFTSILSTLYNSVRYYSFINHFIIKIFMRGANSNDKQKE